MRGKTANVVFVGHLDDHVGVAAIAQKSRGAGHRTAHGATVAQAWALRAVEKTDDDDHADLVRSAD